MAKKIKVLWKKFYKKHKGLIDSLSVFFIKEIFHKIIEWLFQ